MATPECRIARVEQRARQILGHCTEAWMKHPNRTLGGLTPRQLAETSEAGAHVVLTELNQNEIVLRYRATHGRL